jgi:hypothetical protein
MDNFTQLPEDAELHTKIFRRKPLLATLEQKNPLTSLHVYSPDDSVFCTPEEGYD